MTNEEETKGSDQIPEHVREKFLQQIHEAFAYAEIDTVGVNHEMSRLDVRVILSDLVDDYLDLERPTEELPQENQEKKDG